MFFIYSFWYLKGWEIIREWTLKNYVEVITNPTYLILIARSIAIGLTTACVTVILSYPVAYAMVFRMKEGRELILLLMVLSLFSSYLVRVYAWKTILGNTGVINSLLLGLGLVQEPVSWLIYSYFAVIVTLVSVFFPITILPIYSALMNIQPGLLEAARDLGAGAALAFYKITLPLSLPGVVAGFVFTFILTAGDYVTPALLGGSNGQLIGNSIVSQFGTLSNWPLGSAITFFVIGIFFVLFGVGGVLTKQLGLRS
ncbi:MAG: ABC transporter permease [Chloroflexi bacterium]|nr:ABC transporter permease [Chloroflexota bacterium]